MREQEGVAPFRGQARVRGGHHGLCLLSLYYPTGTPSSLLNGISFLYVQCIVID